MCKPMHARMNAHHCVPSPVLKPRGNVALPDGNRGCCVCRSSPLLCGCRALALPCWLPCLLFRRWASSGALTRPSPWPSCVHA